MRFEAGLRPSDRLNQAANQARQSQQETYDLRVRVQRQRTVVRSLSDQVASMALEATQNSAIKVPQP